MIGIKDLNYIIISIEQSPGQFSKEHFNYLFYNMLMLLYFSTEFK